MDPLVVPVPRVIFGAGLGAAGAEGLGFNAIVEESFDTESLSMG